MAGKLIVIEGIDGVGKTSLSQGITRRLREEGISAVRYEEIEDTSNELHIAKSYIKKEASINTSLFFYVASAIHKSEIIQKILKESWVVCDRYIYSTIAHHLAGGANLSLVAEVEKLPIRKPDFFF